MFLLTIVLLFSGEAIEKYKRLGVTKHSFKVIKKDLSQTRISCNFVAKQHQDGPSRSVKK